MMFPLLAHGALDTPVVQTINRYDAATGHFIDGVGQSDFSGVGRVLAAQARSNCRRQQSPLMRSNGNRKTQGNARLLTPLTRKLARRRQPEQPT